MPEPVAVAIAEHLRRSSRTLAVAESLTGGMLTSKLAAAPDASRWLRGGVVAYSREVEYRRLTGARPAHGSRACPPFASACRRGNRREPDQSAS